MDKITFLNYLEDELSRLPKAERDKIMYEYETKFFEAQNEEELIHELGNPKSIMCGWLSSGHIEPLSNKINVP